MQSKKFPSLHVNVEDFIPATDEEKEYLVQMRPSSTFFKDGVKRLLKNKIATINDESQMKLQDTMQKIVNDSNGGMVCIII